MTKSEMLEQVRVNLMRFLEKYKYQDMHIIAKDIGYSYEALKSFRNGERVTLPLAAALVENFPELGEGLTCPHCKTLMIRYR